LGPIGIHAPIFLLPKHFTCFEMGPQLPIATCIFVVADTSYKNRCLATDISVICLAIP
jgi:hypothetical protein